MPISVQQEQSTHSQPAVARARRLLPALAILLTLQYIALQYAEASNSKPTFMFVPTRFIAAIGDPNASSGSGAQSWGLWREDPGPRGVWLRNYAEQLVDTNGVAPADWRFDADDWWLDENGVLMETPVFSLPPGRYIVTGERETVAMLTIHPSDAQGERRWELNNDATLYDVTHLPCRSARYQPLKAGAACSPANAERGQFPISPGSEMPAVAGCRKQDYAVLFVIAEEVTD